VRYNSVYLMLTCMVTFALYAKTFTAIPFIFPSLIIALFLFISIENRWYRAGAEKALGFSRYLAAGGCFVVAAAYIAGLFPPAENTPYRDKFDEFITGQSLALVNLAGTQLDDMVSSTKPDDSDSGEMLLYRVKADQSLKSPYLRRQVFDRWTGEQWEYLNEDAEDYYANDFNEKYTNYSPASEWRKFFENLENVPDELSFWTEAPEPSMNHLDLTPATNARMLFLPAPENAVTIRSGENNEKVAGLAKSVREDYFFDNIPKNRTVYRFDFYDDSPDGAFLSKLTPEITAIMKDAGYEFYMNRLYGNIYGDYTETCLALGDYPKNGEVRELALSLTEGLPSDYEKAKALERYFFNGEFRYSMSFNPKSKAVDYFLFDSKTGTCSDFAAAMTVMAREAGLPARYVEGYVLRERDPSTGEYLVKTKHAHAFTEVFIDGWGWTRFDPTIPAAEEKKLGYFAVLAVLISGAALITGGVLFFVFVLPKIKEARFRKKARGLAAENQVRAFYDRIYGVFMKKLGLRQRLLSSRDLDRLALAEYGVSLADLTENYDRAVFGGLPPDGGDYYGIYERFGEAVREREKKKRKGAD